MEWCVLDVAGFGLALLAMVLFGLYMVPRKLSSLKDFGFLLTMCVGAVVTTQMAQAIAHLGSVPAVTARGAWLAYSCGPIWSLGMLFYALSVSQMGLALATPIKNTSAVVGTLFGLWVFSEWRDTYPLLALLGSVFVVACAVLLGRCGERNGTRSFVTGWGVFFALLAAVFFAAYTIPLKLAQSEGVDSYSLMARMGLGTLAGGTALFLVFSRDRQDWLRGSGADHLYALLAGCCWALATITMSEAIARIGLAVTWPITNLNTVVTVACGIFLYREVDARKHAGTITVALVLAAVGTCLLGLAKQ